MRSNYITIYVDSYSEFVLIGLMEAAIMFASVYLIQKITGAMPLSFRD